MSAGVSESRAILARGSQSFALAGKLLPRDCRDDAAVIYAWCRRADDAVDLAAVDEQRPALDSLRYELSAIYGAEYLEDPVLASFQEVVRRREIPIRYPAELLDGLEMDVCGRRYRTVDELLPYCYCMAGTVGLMMCHVMGVTDPGARRRAADLGIAMQLTNICRDVAEDWARGRVYLPGVTIAAGRSLGDVTVRHAVSQLLQQAEHFYRSGDRGLPALPFRCAVAVRTARLVYSAIGQVVAGRGFDVTRGRAVVPGWRKLALALRALVERTLRRGR